MKTDTEPTKELTLSIDPFDYHILKETAELHGTTPENYASEIIRLYFWEERGV